MITLGGNAAELYFFLNHFPKKKGFFVFYLNKIIKVTQFRLDKRNVALQEKKMLLIKSGYVIMATM